jgi:hypothetical protein
MIDPARTTAALCLAWNIHNIANNAQTNGQFDSALWHALETFGTELEAIRQRERRAELTVVEGGAAR